MPDPDARISVALCSYNGAAYLRAQLDSITAQTLIPGEIVVCDDASTDGTIDILRSFVTESAIPARVHVNTERLGAAKNFEQAVGLCEGDFIALADQDDVWLPEKLAKLHLALESHPGAAYAFCNARLIDADGREIGGKPLLDRRFARGDISRRFDQRRELDLLLKRDFVYGTTLLFRADLRDLVLPIGASWSHDSWIVNMLALCGYGGVPVLETLLLYRQHASQASGGTADPKVTDYATRVCAYEEIRKALVGRTGDGRYSIRSGALARIDDKLRYLRALRDSREQTFLFRARTIAGEILSGRWLRYTPRTFLVDKRVDPGWMLRRS
jgi:glycosyltransferase involved in cell wall biosynthesis